MHSRIRHPFSGGKRSLSRCGVALLGAVAALAMPGMRGEARAQCGAAVKTGFPATTASGAGSAPANDTFINPTAGHSHAYVAQGTALFCILNIAEGGTAAGQRCPGWPVGGWTDTATLSNFPNPVVLSKDANVMNNTAEYIFLTSQDGNLYKINANTGTTVGAGVSTRRGSCAADEVIATPSVQLYRYANAAFQTDMDAHGKTNVDLIIVGTHTMCNDSTRNRVYGFYSDDLSQKWVFNGSFTKKMDFISDGAAVDYATNQVYFGSNVLLGVAQNSLWAISTIDGGDGAGGTAPVWSGNAGSIQNRPQLANGHLYVATVSGAIQAYDALGDGGGNALPLWTTPAQMPGQVTRNLWYETRSGAFQGNFLVLDSLGNLRAYQDTGTTANLLWTQVANNNSSFTSMPALYPSHNFAYVGKADGKILQIDLTHGGWGQDGVVVGSAATIGDPVVDVQGMGATDVDTVTAAAASGSVNSFTAPFSTLPCNAGGTVCSCPAGQSSYPAAICQTQGSCITVQCTGCRVGTGWAGHCANNGVWATNGTVCDDGNACTCDCKNANGSGVCNAGANLDTCWNGKCQGNPVCYTSCSCVKTGDRACGTGNPTAPTSLCCSGTCVDFQNDPKNCGACGVQCQSGKCKRGVCRGDGRCSFPTAATLNGQAANLTGADAIAFDNQSLGANGTCNAYLSSYRTATDSSIYEVSPTGTVTTIANSTNTDLTPLNGVSVPQQGDQVFAGLINDAMNTYSPELAISKPLPNAYTRSGAMTAASKTSGTGPFNDTRFNQGPVGPAFDWVDYNGTDNSRVLYYGNWVANGDIYKLTYNGSWSAAPLAPMNDGPTLPSRITAIAFGRRYSSDVSENQQPYFAVAFGTQIRLFVTGFGNWGRDCNNQAAAPNTCVDLSTWTPPMGDTEGAPAKILGLAISPAFGDMYAEVEDNHNPPNVYILNVDVNDLTIRREHDCADDQNIRPNNMPILVGTGYNFEGQIQVMPDLDLLHIAPTVDGAPVFRRYEIIHN